MLPLAGRPLQRLLVCTESGLLYTPGKNKVVNLLVNYLVSSKHSTPLTVADYAPRPLPDFHLVSALLVGMGYQESGYR